MSATLGRRPLLLLGTLVCLIHVLVVLSLVVQPFNVREYPEQQSLIWPLHNDTVHRDGPAADFLALYHSGLQVERGASPYERAAAREELPPFYLFRYLPVVAETLGRAATLLPPRAAYVCWIVLLEFVLLAACAWLMSRAPRRWLGLLGPCLLLLSSPYFLELHMGQFSFLTAVLYVGALIACSQPVETVRSSLAASVMYACAVLLKVVPLVAIPALIRTRRGWLCVDVAIVALVATSVPPFLLHPLWWREFVALNLTPRMESLHGGNFGLLLIVFRAGEDLRGPWTETGWRHVGEAAQLLFLGAAALAAFFSRRQSPVIGGALLYFGHTLSYSSVWEHHMSGVIVVGIALLWGLEESRASGRLVAIAALVCLALPTPFVLFDHALNPAVADPSISWSRFARYLVPLSKAAPVLALYGVSLRALTSRASTEPVTP